MARVNRATIELAAKDTTRPAFASVAGNFKGLQGQVDNIASRFGGLQTTILSTLSGFGAGALVKGIADQLDAFNDLADATGASIENLSRLDRAARRTGGTFEDVSALLNKFNQALVRAKPGSDQARAFEALGLSVEELRRQDPAEALLTTAEALQSFTQDGELARVQTLLLGESVAKLAPLLKDLAENSSEVGTVTREQAEAADAFNKSMASLTATAQDFGRTAVADVLPVLTETLRAFERSDTAARDFAEGGGLLRTALEALVITGANVAFVFDRVVAEVDTIGRQLVALGRLDITQFNALSDAVKEDGRRARAELDAFEQRILTAGRRVGSAMDQFAAETARLQRQAGGRTIEFMPGADSAKAEAARAADLARQQAEAQRSLQALLAASTPMSATAVNSLIEFGEVVIDLPTQVLPAVTAQQELEDGFRRIEKAALEMNLEVPVQEINRLDERTQRFLDNVQDGFGDTLYRTLKGDFDNILDLWADLLLRMLAEAAAADFAAALGLGADKNKGGNLASLLDGIVGIFAGTGRANGGSVKAGGLYPINELGGPGEVLSAGGRQYLLATQDGYVNPGRRQGMAAAGVEVVNNTYVQTPPGMRAETSESRNSTGGIDTMVRLIDERMAAGIASGNSRTARTMQGTYGLSRASGAPRRG